jgi:hypothetical protein
MRLVTLCLPVVLAWMRHFKCYLQRSITTKHREEMSALLHDKAILRHQGAAEEVHLQVPTQSHVLVLL